MRGKGLLMNLRIFAYMLSRPVWVRRNGAISLPLTPAAAGAGELVARLAPAALSHCWAGGIARLRDLSVRMTRRPAR